MGSKPNEVALQSFDQWPKLHLGLDALSNEKILKGIYSYEPHQWDTTIFEGAFVISQHFCETFVFSTLQ